MAVNMMEYINEFVKPELLILVPVLYLLGYAIKKSNLSDNFIPLILGGCGIVLSCIYVFSLAPIASQQDLLAAIFTAITQGILCAGASVYVNQLIKQAAEYKEDIEDTENIGEGE
jgi:1,4-dihydroxy-2-naphthoate octaprenyltransferase